MKTKLFLLVVIFGLMSCQKKLEIVPDENLYEVSFSPTLYGQVIPGLKTDAPSKGFAEFTHKFFIHVIRIRTASTLTMVIDIPIVTPSPSNTYTYQLPVGDYIAEVLPITEQSATGVGTYTAFTDFGNTAISRASFYTRTSVPFTVSGSLASPVLLNCVTDMACLQLNLGEKDYVTAAIARPNIVGIWNPLFLGNHNIAGQEPATVAQLNTELGGGNGYQILANPAPVAYTEFGNFWFDDVARIYYLYRIPGVTGNISVPNGLGASVNITQGTASYLTFNLDATYPTIWLRDYYTTRTWLPNTTLRVTYLMSMFQVDQSNWFSTILTK